MPARTPAKPRATTRKPAPRPVVAPEPKVETPEDILGIVVEPAEADEPEPVAIDEPAKVRAEPAQPASVVWDCPRDPEMKVWLINRFMPFRHGSMILTDPDQIAAMEDLAARSGDQFLKGQPRFIGVDDNGDDLGLACEDDRHKGHVYHSQKAFRLHQQILHSPSRL